MYLWVLTLVTLFEATLIGQLSHSFLITYILEVASNSIALWCRRVAQVWGRSESLPDCRPLGLTIPKLVSVLTLSVIEGHRAHRLADLESWHLHWECLP